MSIDTPRIGRLLKHLETYKRTGALPGSSLNGNDRSIVREAARSGDAAGYIRRHCCRPDQTSSLMACITSLDTWKHSLAEIAKALGIAKSAASHLLDRAKRLSRGAHETSCNEPSVTFSAIWIGKFIHFAAIEFQRMPVPTAEPGELTPDLLSASLERNALLDFEQELTKIDQTTATANSDGLTALSACAQEIREFRRFLHRLSSPCGENTLRYGLLELIVPSDRQMRMESAVTKAITRAMGDHPINIVRHNFSETLIQTLASIPSHSVSTGFFPDIRNAVLPSLRSIRAGVSSYRRTRPDIPHYGSKPRREIRRDSNGRLYPNTKRPCKSAPLLPRAAAGKIRIDAECTINTADSWQSLFAAVTSDEFTNLLVEENIGQLQKASKLERGMNSLIPWLTSPYRVVSDILAGTRGDALKERLVCGLALLHFAPEFIIEKAASTYDPLIKKWSDQIAQVIHWANRKQQRDFAHRFAKSLLIAHMNEIRGAFVAAIRDELPRLTRILFMNIALAKKTALAENSSLRSFWPQDVSFGKENLHQELQCYFASNACAPPRQTLLSMDADDGDGNSGTSLHECLSSNQGGDWEDVAETFRRRLAMGGKSAMGDGATEMATEIAQMLKEEGKDYAHFIGLLPNAMAREVRQAISD